MYIAGELKADLANVPDDVVIIIMLEQDTDACTEAVYSQFFILEDEDYGSSFAIFPEKALKEA